MSPSSVFFLDIWIIWYCVISNFDICCVHVWELNFRGWEAVYVAEGRTGERERRIVLVSLFSRKFLYSLLGFLSHII